MIWMHEYNRIVIRVIIENDLDHMMIAYLLLAMNKWGGYSNSKDKRGLSDSDRWTLSERTLNVRDTGTVSFNGQGPYVYNII